MGFIFDDTIIGLDPDDAGHIPLDVDSAFDSIEKLPDKFAVTVPITFKEKHKPSEIKTSHNNNGTIEQIFGF